MSTDEKSHDEDQARRDLDLTTPNIISAREEGVRTMYRGAGPDQAGRAFELTTPNIRLPKEDAQPDRPAAARNGFDLTAMHVGFPAADEEDVAPTDSGGLRPQERPLPPATAPRPSAAVARRTRRWVWLAGGGLALVLAAAVLLVVLFTASPAFTLKVLEAPPGSRLFVDNVTSGVPVADGAIIVQGLKADEPREVRVTREGFEEWSTTVKGGAGEEVVITAKLAPKVKQAPTTGEPGELVTEIDYHGPMVLIPAGSFVMGDNRHGADERPEHEVNLPTYYIDKYEVTNEQYKKFCNETGHPRPPSPWWDERYFDDQPRSPVVGINWDDAVAYAKWAGKRLPTEAEWEKAAGWDPNTNRKRQWPWGDAPEENRANLGLKRETLRLVAVDENSSGASAYGVYNMAGNVAEWTDAYYQPYDGNRTPNRDFGTDHRVMRGGACFNSIGDARTTRRLYRPPQYTAREQATGGTFVIGFRCAVSADDAKLQEELGRQGPGVRGRESE